MRVWITILSVFMVCILLSSCKKEEQPLITSKAGIYWGRPEYEFAVSDSQYLVSNTFNLIAYSFGYVPDSQRSDIPGVWVSTVGGVPVDYYLPFSI
jgi:hypothetical protein